METINKQTLLELANHQSSHCISIYIPTHVRGSEVNEGYDSILFKNQVQKVRNKLQEQGLRSNEIADLMAPLEELLKDKEFWRNQREGLGVLRSQEVFEVIQTSMPLPELCHVNHQFLLRPLFPILQNTEEYYILKITRKGVGLFKAGRFAIEAIESQDVFPSGIDEILEPYEFDSESQGQPQSKAGSMRGEASVYRGTKEENKMKDHLLADYFRQINEGIKQLIGENNKPLVLACVEYYQPIYRQVNSYPHLEEKALTGSFDQASIHELHEKANELMSDYFLKKQERRISQYQNSSGQNLISHDLRHILESAVTGRIDTLFVKHDAQVWGHFDEQNLTATMHSDPRDGDEPLVDQAIVLTLRNGGEVYMLDSVDLLPQPDDDNAGVAALYRF